MSATFDATTTAAYEAATTAEDRAAAIVASLTGTISVKVYDGDDTEMGSGTMASPWATASAGVVTLGEVSSFTVGTTATPDADWYIRFENSDASRWARGSFGLSGSGQDYTWSLTTWTEDQTGTIGTATIIASGNSAPAFTVAPTSASIAATGGTIQFTATDPEGGSIFYSLTTTRAGITINASTGLVTVTAAAAGTSGNIVVQASDGILAADTSCSVTVASSGSIKWNPGFYVYYSPSKYPRTNYTNIAPTPLAQMLTFMDEIKDEPIKGIQVIAYWGEYEGGTAGDYSGGFSWVDALLAKAVTNGQHLLLGVQPVHYGNYPSNWTFAFPAYIVAPANGGTDAAGTYGITPQNINGTGLQTRIWQKATMDRLIALSQAYGARYNSHANFEMFATGETSVNITVGTNGYSFAAFDAQLKRQMTADRAAWPNTAIRLNANYYFSSTNNVEVISLVDYARNEKIAVGGPDVLPDETIRANQAFTGAYAGSTDWRGVIPFVAEVQSPELGGKEGTYTNEQLYLAAMQGISTASGGATGSGSAVFRATRPQYFVWYYNTWSGGDEQKWATGTLPFIQSISGAVYSTTYPSGY